MRRNLLLAAALLALAPASAAAEFGEFRAVLAQGEGQSASPTDLAAHQGFGTVPDSFTSQTPLYAGIMPAAASLTAAGLDRYYRRTDFGTVPGGVLRSYSPKDGVTVVRDAFNVAHINAATRADVMWASGYVQAEERLFLMDVIRRMAKGTMAGLLGAGSAGDDAAQLTDQDFSDQELTAQYERLPGTFGTEGTRAHQDLRDYVAGINARISEVNANPLLRPAEYAALGTTPAPWSIADSAAAAVLLVTQFTVSNGGEEVNAELQHAFRERFGRRWRAVHRDFRQAQDPGAIVVAKRPFRSDDPGRYRAGRNAIPDKGSIEPRSTLVAGPSQADQARARARLPEWARKLAGLRRALPTTMSNAVMVTRRVSATGRALAAMGPQVGYYSPQIFSELDLHGGGIAVSGVTFPGASPYPLIGHGIDFAWSGTSANGDNQDTFVEFLCEPDGSKPTKASTHYRYKGECRKFTSRDQTVTTPLSPLDPTALPQEITYRTLRSVHGPVFAYATVGGEPVALAKAKAVDFHELDAVVPFMKLAENAPTDARSFMSVMSGFPGTENWFYVDSDEVAFLQSGRYPRHARGADVDLPFRGDGPGDWQRFDPETYTARYIPSSRRPQSIDPRDGFIISWNQKEAIGWRKGPREWSGGPVQDALRLERRLKAELRQTGNRIDLAGLTRAVSQASTTDLRGEDVLPWMLRVLGRPPAALAAHVERLRSWIEAGAQRLDADGDNLYEHGGAVALFDAWWPLAMKAMFEPVLGKELYEDVGQAGLSAGAFDRWGWVSHAQKDLRAVMGKRFAGRFKHVFCASQRPLRQPLGRRALRRARAACQSALAASLGRAAEDVAARLGADPNSWQVPATCPETSPPSCDQIVPVTAGAIATPPFPWQDRGTYHQVVEVTGHR